MNQLLQNTYKKMFKNKFLIILLSVVLLFFIIHQIFRTQREGFEANEDDETKAENLGQWLAKNLAPPLKQEENIEGDAYTRIESEFTRTLESSVPHYKAKNLYEEERKKSTGPPTGSKENPNDADARKVADLDKEYTKYLWGNDSTQFNNETNDEDKKRIFRYAELRINDLPKKDDTYFTSINNKVQFINKFKQSLQDEKNNMLSDDLKDVNNTKKEFYEKAIEVSQDYISETVKGNTYTGSTAAEGFKTIESFECEAPGEINYNEDYWKGFKLSVDNNKDLKLKKNPDGTEVSECYEFNKKKEYKSCSTCNQAGYNAGKAVNVD